MSIVELELVFEKGAVIKGRVPFVPFTTGSKIEVQGDAIYKISEIDIKYDGDKTAKPTKIDDKYSWDMPEKNKAETLRVVAKNATL